MREGFNSLIKSCGTRTVPVAETKSIGLQADARVVMVFARYLNNFIVTRQLSSTCRDLVPSNSFIVTSGCSSIYQDLQKPRHRDADGNSLNRRAVSCKANYRSLILPGLPTRAQEFCSPSLQPSRRCKTHAFWPARTQPFRQIFIHSQIQLVYRDFTIKTN
jgi:hypothetical protein